MKLTPKTAKRVEGKTVARISIETFDDGRGRLTCFPPVIVFTDGSVMTFTVHETEHDQYGIDVTLTANTASRRRRRRAQKGPT